MKLFRGHIQILLELEYTFFLETLENTFELFGTTSTVHVRPVKRRPRLHITVLALPN